PGDVRRALTSLRLHDDGGAESSVRPGAAKDEDFAGCGDGNRLPTQIVGKHPAGAFSKRLLLGGTQADSFEAQRLSNERDRDAVCPQAVAPGVHLDLPAAFDRDPE